MDFSRLVCATLVRRYKRFLADVELEDGSLVTVHCPNTGAMTGCAEPGSRVWLSQSENPKRKYRHTWELVETPAGDLACIHSALANRLVVEAIENDVIAELSGYPTLRREVKLGAEGSRIDVMLESPQAGRCYIEVKSVTLLADPVPEFSGQGVGLFPDAKSDRASKHLRELIAAVEQGHRAVLLFAVLHTGIRVVAPADAIDPNYGNTLREALRAGVEVLVYAAQISTSGMNLQFALPLQERQPGLEP